MATKERFVEQAEFFGRNPEGASLLVGSGDSLMPETKKPGELAQFASDLQLMKHRAINLRLHATGQWLDSAIQTLAFEIAGHTERSSKYEAPQVASKRNTVLAVNGREFHFREATPCPRCGSTESEMRTYGGSWDDADTHCAQCGKLIHRAWFATRGC